MKKKHSIKWNIITVLVIALILAICFVAATLQVNQIATKSCYRTLNDTANQLSSDIRSEIRNNEEELEILSSILVTHDNITGTVAMEHLEAFQCQSSFAALAILLPDQSVRCTDQKDMGLDLDFRKESIKTPYVSGICTRSSEPDEKYLYMTVPVVQDGILSGILYGFVDLDTFANQFTINAFEGQCDLYIIDGETGDFLLDTLHDSLGNINDPEMNIQEVRQGYDFEDMKNHITQGKAGYFAFRSNTYDEYLYTRYSPAGINRWMVQVTVPESVVFSNARKIRYVIYILAAIYIVAFLLYFIWTLLRNRKEAMQKERQLSQSLYMYNVQQALYDAPKKPELIPNALHIVGSMLTAEAVILTVIRNEGETALYSWHGENGAMSEEDLKGLLLRDAPPRMWKSLRDGKTLMFYPKDLSRLAKDEQEALALHHIYNMILVPVRDTENRLIALLASLNMQEVWSDGVLLECVAGNFLLTLQNMNSYQLIQRMGTIDAVTGLKNRNSYQLALNSYANIKDESLCCIYADANGLHELNNHLGHAAGDAMLRYIGDSLKEIFGSNDAYRIGGDEFVVFCHHCSEKDVERKLSLLHEKMQEKDYHISVGTSWLHTAVHLDHLVADAECKMYEAKRLYYQKKGNISKAREMNRKLEKILLEKKDADNFIRIISSYFMGVYVVNLNTDSTRSIYCPQHFTEKLEKTANHFLPAMEIYIVKHVHPDDKEGLQEFLNYQNIDQMLRAGKNPEHTYHKPNGMKVRIRIYPADQYSENEKETFWLFEEYTK
ncbi:sensor domain-containing diguanylate cyclase [uncultured Ruminococcus sp.]|uniref:sensor domain-containing diguanylate cyclase n=1 Tax=uncultured Ruminococcus sp. TaxID=165186 RepID=UPI00260D780C|nr:sensor domain-containing diguanylate cyclase [uncultured Ruminococcus sp.]